jgi:hypothetical protein
VSITFWDSREAASAATGVAEEWVLETVADQSHRASPALRIVRSDDAPAAI